MQEKKIIGKTYEGTEEYVAFFVKGYYVLVQESSLCGLDYTIYDANTSSFGLFKKLAAVIAELSMYISAETFLVSPYVAMIESVFSFI